MSYGENTNEDFLKSFSDLPDVLYYMVFFAYMIVVTFSMPVVFFCGRNYLMTLITKYAIKKYDEHCPYWFYLIVSYGFYCIIILMGLFISNITTIFSFVGAICSNSICYIFPAAIYLGIGKKNTMFYKWIWVLLFFGISAGVVSIVGTAITLGS